MTNKFSEAMDTGKFYVGKICTDCLSVVANGDSTGNSDDWDEATFTRNCNEYDVTLGHPHFRTEWFDDCPHSGERCPDDCDCERDSFSRSSCDLCGTYLAGERHDVIMIRRSLLERESND